MNRNLAGTLAAVILLSLSCAGCERQAPPPKPIGAATNKHAEEAPASPARPNADAMLQHMENARQTEAVLKGAADRASDQADQATP
ncbi:MAG TPA: hypothetical protein VFM24_07905 [Nitrospira sp.]|nr:hypothetical protein [Nitrospira sp.]